MDFQNKFRLSTKICGDAPLLIYIVPVTSTITTEIVTVSAANHYVIPRLKTTATLQRTGTCLSSLSLVKRTDHKTQFGSLKKIN